MPDTVKFAIVTVLNAFLLLLFVRLVIGWVLALSRDWRPTGIWIIVFEVTYTLTDPPLRALRRVIPTLQMGRFAIDLSFILLFIIVQVLISQVARL